MVDGRKLWLNGVLVGSLLLGGTTVYGSGADKADVSMSNKNISALAVQTASQIENRLLTALSEREPMVSFTYSGRSEGLSSLLDTALERAISSDPYVQYVIKRYSYNWRSTSASASITVYLEYRESAEQTAYVDREVQRILRTVLKPGMNDHEKVKAIHDWIVLHLAYDVTLKKDTAYAALKEGATVCQGYALLAYKMLKEAGIENRIVEGEAGGQLHVWNLVRLDGLWYHLDTTWDDPVPDRKNEVSYQYYLRTDDQMQTDHKWKIGSQTAMKPYDQTVEQLKRKDAEKRDFYEQLEIDLNYIYLKPDNIASTVEQLVAKAKDVLASGRNAFTIRYTRGDTVQEDMKQVLARVEGLTSVRYQSSAFGKAGDILLEIEMKR